MASLLRRALALPQQIVGGVVGGISGAVAVAAHTVAATLRSAPNLTDTGALTPSPAPATELGRTVNTLRDAQRAAVASRDFALAHRLNEVERFLLAPPPRRASELLVPRQERSSLEDQIEAIRKDLLAKTPRPSGADDD